jgi:hypothetical protein
MVVMFALCSAGSLAACGGDDEEDEELAPLPDVDCDNDVPAFSEVTGFDKCNLCHGSNVTGDERQDAPDDDTWDVYERAADEADQIVHELREGAMPPADSGITLTAAEKDAMYHWALCGAPE